MSPCPVVGVLRSACKHVGTLVYPTVMAPGEGWIAILRFVVRQWERAGDSRRHKTPGSLHGWMAGM